MKKIFLLIIVFLIGNILYAQNQKVLIAVSKVADGKIKVEWENPYGDSMVQLNVQRSWDSIKNYLTVFVPLSPELPQNGFIDESRGFSGMYYRLFYVLADGSFFFTKGIKTTLGSHFTNEISADQAADKNFLITVHDDDTVLGQFKYDQYKKFRDSIIYYTRDTLYSLTDADILIRYYNNEMSWIPSARIFTNSDGYVQINLAEALEKKYRLRFFDDKHKLLFSIQHVKQVQLLLDKTDFMRSGWFYFELYENDKVKERNKFYIPKDF